MRTLQAVASSVLLGSSLLCASTRARWTSTPYSGPSYQLHRPADLVEEDGALLEEGAYGERAHAVGDRGHERIVG
jgi:hypothetical protein